MFRQTGTEKCQNNLQRKYTSVKKLPSLKSDFTIYFIIMLLQSVTKK